MAVKVNQSSSNHGSDLHVKVGGVFAPIRCRANLAHTRQSGPEYGPSFQVQDFKTLQVVPPSIGSGLRLLWRVEPGHAEEEKNEPSTLTHETYILSLIT